MLLQGVIWHGDRLIPGVVEFLKLLRKLNKTCVFVTNNATRSREQFKQKFDKLGVQASVVRPPDLRRLGTR